MVQNHHRTFGISPVCNRIADRDFIFPPGGRLWFCSSQVYERENPLIAYRRIDAYLFLIHLPPVCPPEYGKPYREAQQRLTSSQGRSHCRQTAGGQKAAGKGLAKPRLPRSVIPGRRHVAAGRKISHIDPQLSLEMSAPPLPIR